MAQEREQLPTFDELYGQGNNLSFNLIFVDLQKVVCMQLQNHFPLTCLENKQVQVFQGSFEDYLVDHKIDCIVSASNAFGLMDHGFDRSLCRVFNQANKECNNKNNENNTSKLQNNLKSKIQSKIIETYNGEQPIGTCLIIKIPHSHVHENSNSNHKHHHFHRIKYLAYAPTRRVNYSIKGTDNVYCAMKAVCDTIEKFNQDWIINHQNNENNENNNQSGMHDTINVNTIDTSDMSGKTETQINNNNINFPIKNVLLTGMATFYGALRPEESARQTVLGWLISRLVQPELNEINWKFAMKRQSLIKYGGYTHFIDELVNNPINIVNLSSQQQKQILKSLPKNIVQNFVNYGESNSQMNNLNTNNNQNSDLNNNNNIDDGSNEKHFHRISTQLNDQINSPGTQNTNISNKYQNYKNEPRMKQGQKGDCIVM